MPQLVRLLKYMIVKTNRTKPRLQPESKQLSSFKKAHLLNPRMR